MFPLVCLLIVVLRRAAQMDFHSWNLGFFAGGILFYFALHIFFWKPIFLYVVSHELTHALWAKIFGGSVRDLSVTQRGGRVTVNRSNFLINLAPYFFPLYLLACLGVDILAQPKFHPYILVFLGASVGFHFVLTVSSLHGAQPDLIETGYVFSIVFIAFINLILVCAVLWRVDPKAFDPGILYDEFLAEFFLLANQFWGLAAKFV